VLERDERAVGVAEDGVALEAERDGEGVDVARVLLERPRLRRRRVRAPLGPLVDQQQPEGVAERVEVVPNSVWSSPGPPCRTMSAVAPAPRSLTCRRVSPTSTSTWRILSWGWMSEQDHTPQLPGGWLPPVADERSFGAPRRPWWRRAGSGLLAALLVVGAKLKTILILLPKLKVLTTSGSMLVSVAAYSLIWGWRFAIGFVVLLFVHEMGHVIALRREGVQASAPVFIPFLGAAVWAKSLGGNAVAEARVGLAGPVLGTIGAAACLPIAAATGSDLWTALAFTGFFLNLFNLLPVVPLDGGRAMAAMAPWMWFVGLGAVVALAIAFPNPIIVLIAVVGAFDVYGRWTRRRRGDTQARSYYRVSPRDRALVAAVYVGLIALLVLGMDATHLQRSI
jgi:Zn-dependent protease